MTIRLSVHLWNVVERPSPTHDPAAAKYQEAFENSLKKGAQHLSRGLPATRCRRVAALRPIRQSLTRNVQLSNDFWSSLIDHF